LKRKKAKGKGWAEGNEGRTEADENLFLRVTILLLFSFLLVGWQGFVIQTNEKEE
jgi:nitrate reductase NapE component